ncbi:MAG: hypothetical protein LUF89_11645 [Ruminococcus sp.]|nr:hypothetical protein [Ruminococcus sp.]
MRKSIYTCPYCGTKSFHPWTKAFVGGMHTKGRPCKACGRRCVNGMASMIFSAIVYIVALVFVVIVYLGVANYYWNIILIGGTIVAAYLLCRLFDAFIGPLVPTVRNDANS